MYRKCTTEISALHQRKVTESLLELMRKMPYEDITVTALCKASGVTRRIFYHLFNNKTGALHALIDQKILDLESYQPDETNELLRFFRYWQEQKPLLEALQKNGLAGLLSDRIILIALTENHGLLIWLQKNGWPSSREIIIYQVSGLMGLVYNWYHGGFQKPPEAMAALVTSLIPSHPPCQPQEY